MVLVVASTAVEVSELSGEARILFRRCRRRPSCCFNEKREADFRCCLLASKPEKKKNPHVGISSTRSSTTATSNNCSFDGLSFVVK